MSYQHLNDLESIVQGAQVATAMLLDRVTASQTRVNRLKIRRKDALIAAAHRKVPDLSPATINKIRQGEIGHLLNDSLQEIFRQAIKAYPHWTHRAIARIYWTEAFEIFAMFENGTIPLVEETVREILSVNRANIPSLEHVRCFDAKLVPAEDELRTLVEEYGTMRKRSEEAARMRARVEVMSFEDVPKDLLANVADAVESLRIAQEECMGLESMAAFTPNPNNAAKLRESSFNRMLLWLRSLPENRNSWGLLALT